MKKIVVAVLYGGRSGEHEVSVASAASVLANLDPARYEAIPVRIAKNGRWLLGEPPPTTTSAAHVIGAARAADAESRPPGPLARGREALLLARPSRRSLISLPETDAPTNGLEASMARLGRSAIDVVFPVLHGPYGEDGTVQGLLELADIPYVGAGVLASAVGMDKTVMKVLFAARGLPIVDYLTVRRHEWRESPARVSRDIVGRLALPVFVKPANLGSSVGISKASTVDELTAAVDLAGSYDRKIVVEAAVPNAREIECAVLGNERPEASVPGEVIPSREFYDYVAKYLDEGSEIRIPAEIDEGTTAKIRRLALEAYAAVDCEGMARVDFLLTRSGGSIYVNELNTIPGFTTISMYAKLWEATGLSYPDLLDRLITLAFERHQAKSTPLSPDVE